MTESHDSAYTGPSLAVRLPQNSLWIAASVLLQCAAMACIKMAGGSGGGEGPLSFVFNPWYASALGFLALQALCWISAIRQLPLSFAYPFMSLTFPINLLVAHTVFHETVVRHHIAGTVLIVLGVVIIARETPQ